MTSQLVHPNQGSSTFMASLPCDDASNLAHHAEQKHRIVVLDLDLDIQAVLRSAGIGFQRGLDVELLHQTGDGCFGSLDSVLLHRVSLWLDHVLPGATVCLAALLAGRVASRNGEVVFQRW